MMRKTRTFTETVTYPWYEPGTLVIPKPLADREMTGPQDWAVEGEVYEVERCGDMHYPGDLAICFLLDRKTGKRIERYVLTQDLVEVSDDADT